jgi:hypothetical protein
MTDDGRGCGVGLVITARETERRIRLGWGRRVKIQKEIFDGHGN